MTEAFDLALFAYAKIMPKSDHVDNQRIRGIVKIAGKQKCTESGTCCSIPDSEETQLWRKARSIAVVERPSRNGMRRTSPPAARTSFAPTICSSL
jgi:hypothetical protein